MNNAETFNPLANELPNFIEMLEEITDSVLIINKDFNIFFSNSSASALFNQPNSSLVGAKVTTLLNSSGGQALLASPKTLEDIITVSGTIEIPIRAEPVQKLKYHVRDYWVSALDGEQYTILLFRFSENISELNYLATHDSLTNCLNCNQLLPTLESFSNHRAQRDTTLTLFHIDVDNFKKIIANSLECPITAKGIDSQQQVRLLKKHGFKYAQGGFLHPQLPFEDLKQLLSS